MESEAFYATGAQVLPTLLIAVMVESLLVTRSYARWSKSTGEARGCAATGCGYAFILGFTFVVGESLAFLALGFRWFNGWTFFGVGASLVVMGLAAVAIPLLRIMSEDGKAED